MLSRRPEQSGDNGVFLIESDSGSVSQNLAQTNAATVSDGGAVGYHYNERLSAELGCLAGAKPTFRLML